MLNRISVNGTELEYELRGTGGEEPVVLIHWGVAAKWAEPLLDQHARPAATSCSAITAQASPAAAR
jgi:hypothetical protein